MQLNSFVNFISRGGALISVHWSVSLTQLTAWPKGPEVAPPVSASPFLRAGIRLGRPCHASVEAPLQQVVRQRFGCRSMRSHPKANISGPTATSPRWSRGRRRPTAPREKDGSTVQQANRRESRKTSQAPRVQSVMQSEVPSWSAPVLDQQQLPARHRGERIQRAVESSATPDCSATRMTASQFYPRVPLKPSTRCDDRQPGAPLPRSI